MADLSRDDLRLLVTIAQGAHRLYYDHARARNLIELGYLVGQADDIPDHTGQLGMYVELTGKGEALLRKHVPEAFQRYTQQGPIGRAVSPFHDKTMQRQMLTYAINRDPMLRGDTAERAEWLQGLRELDPEAEAEARIAAGVYSETIDPKMAKLQKKGIAERIRRQQARIDLQDKLSKEKEVAERAAFGGTWKDLTSTALKRAQLKGYPMSVSREVMKELGRYNTRLKGVDMRSLNPLDIRFMRYTGPYERWHDPVAGRSRVLRRGSMVIADANELKNRSTSVATRGKGFVRHIRREHLQHVGDLPPRMFGGNLVGQLFVSGKEAGAARAGLAEAKREGARSFFKRNNPRIDIQGGPYGGIKTSGFDNPTGIRIVHNRLLGGWYIVRGSQQTPISGRFDSKAEAQAWLNRRNNPLRVNPVWDRRAIANAVGVLPAGAKHILRSIPNLNTSFSPDSAAERDGLRWLKNAGFAYESRSGYWYLTTAGKDAWWYMRGDNR